MSKPPINLPELTFLLGPNDPQKHALAHALRDRDPELFLCDLETPIREATSQLFFDGDFFNSGDLTKPESRSAKLLNTNETVQDWLTRFEALLRLEFGTDILGQLLAKRLDDEGTFQIFDRVLVTDVTNPADIRPFGGLKHSELLVIHTGPLTTPLVPDIRTVWLAVPELELRLAQLERELESATLPSGIKHSSA